jgi:outer membrane protein OmpA-like peptidoglycan-associated protein
MRKPIAHAFICAATLCLAGGAAAQQGNKSLEEIMRGLMSTEGSRGVGGMKTKPGEAPAPGEARVAVPIEFEYNSAAVSSASRQQLEIVAQALNSEELRTFRIGIEGHTDESGSAEYNLRLSDSRAAAVRKYLVGQLGVSPDRLDARGYGESRPLAGVSQATEEGRARNRRVEFVNLGRATAGAGAAPPAAAAASKPTVRVVVHYQRSGNVQVLEPGGALESKDDYRVSFTADQDAFVYLYQIDSSGKVQPLFPNSELSKASNPVKAKQTYEVPPDAGWLTLDANRGEEQIVTIASAKALDDPKSIAFSKWSSIASGESRGVNPVARPGRASGAGADVFLGQFRFLHR